MVDPRAELEATKSLLALIEAAEACREAYVRANMALPEPLQRFFGITDKPLAQAKHVHAALPEPDVMRPRNVADGWVPIPLANAMPPTITLAALRAVGGGPIRAKDLIDKVVELLPSASRGSIANAGTKLEEEGLIGRDDEGWRLRDIEMAPLIFEGHVWAPAESLGRQEITAYRRSAVLHLLKIAPSGLQTAQILEQLRHQCPWLLAPVNKEIIQDDIETLQSERKVRRRGASRKWELAPEKGAA